MIKEHLDFWTRETISNVRRNRLMSLLAINTVAVGLVILGASFLILGNLRALVHKETDKLDLTLFLRRGISPERRKQIYDASRIPQVADLRIVSRSKVLEEFQRERPRLNLQDFQGAENPFGDQLRIKLRNPQQLFQVQAYFKTIKDIQDINLSSDDAAAVRRLLDFSNVLAWASGLAMLVLGVSILLIIHNAIRLTIFARRREIRIMELVGATPGFIRVPFLLEGTFYGVAGAVVASLVVAPAYLALGRSSTALIQMLMPLAHSDLLLQVVGWMLVVGFFFGLIGAWISLSRSLGRTAAAF